LYDLAIIENESSGLLHREYAGVTFQGQYRFGTKADVGGSYTLSHLWGNVDGENVTSGPITDTALQYPEYKEAEWNFPDGDLSADQRHRARLWLTYNLPWGLSLGLVQALESGAPYSASNQNAALFNGINPQPRTNPGYCTRLTADQPSITTARDASVWTEGRTRRQLTTAVPGGPPPAHGPASGGQPQPPSCADAAAACCQRRQRGEQHHRQHGAHVGVQPGDHQSFNPSPPRRCRASTGLWDELGRR
jgi:hypothetical protein